MRYLFVIFALYGAPVFAQNAPWTEVATEACLSSTGNDLRCVGVSASQCIEQDGTYSTAAMTGCLVAEHKYWDTRLNAAYQSRMAEAQETEISDVDLAENLRDMQRTWIAFRDQKCQYSANQYYGGTIAQLVYAQCLMDTTAAQARFLEKSQVEQ